MIAAQGRTPYVTAARAGAEGPLVAFTDIVVTRHDPINTFQWNTLVLREHRGHRLGMLVKAVNLQRRLVAAPAAERLHTWNAVDNSEERQVSTSTYGLVEIATTDEVALRTWFDLRRHVQDYDRPGDPRESWQATIWLPQQENLDLALVQIEVHPDHRRAGLGTRLLTHLADVARADRRTRLVGEIPAGIGEDFTRHHGFHVVLAATLRRLDLAALDAGEHARLRADGEAHAAGCSLHQWKGATPEPMLEGMAQLMSRMNTDAPLDDLALEQQVYDVKRVQEADAAAMVGGNRLHTTGAVHDKSGEVAGTTTLSVLEGEDEVAGQWTTIVLPAHRGHRLAMLLKLANLDFLRAHEPAVRRVFTENADSNAPMLAVNVAMGFRPVRGASEWERAVDL